MDVYHFFESCKAQAVMRCLRRIYKDRAFLALHETILRSMGDGLAIGFYPSPWYGNLVLCFAIDRVVEHQARKAFHVRYVDDVAILANSKRLLRRLRAALAESLAAYGLEMKANWAIYPTAKQPIAFLTYRFYRGYTLVRKGIMYRLTRCARACGKNLTPSRAMAMISYKGILQRCNSYRLRKDHVYPYTNFKKCRKVVKYVASICGIYRTAPELCGA